jgi:hypothetical protein
MQEIHNKHEEQTKAELLEFAGERILNEEKRVTKDVFLQENK